jgi:DNA-binding response OmpR family regulator
MSPTNPAPTETRRVLVIDDEEVVHASLRKILSRLGFRIEAVFCASDALDKLTREPFDLVITDLMMPAMNGIELLEQLKKLGIAVPVIMVTGYPTISTAVQALRLGAMDYVPKPFTRKELLSPVQRALRLGHSSAAVDESEASVPERPLQPGDVLFLPHHAWARVEEDGTLSIGIEESFLQAAGKISTITPPEEVQMVEQGYVGLVLHTTGDESHGVAMPVSGQVVSHNAEAFQNPGAITAQTWLLRVIPGQLDTEVALLARRS